MTAPTTTITIPRMSDIAVVPFNKQQRQVDQDGDAQDVDDARRLETVERVADGFPDRHQPFPSAPRTSASSAFCACSRFSAWSKTTD